MSFLSSPYSANSKGEGHEAYRNWAGRKAFRLSGRVPSAPMERRYGAHILPVAFIIIFCRGLRGMRQAPEIALVFSGRIPTPFRVDGNAVDVDPPVERGRSIRI